ncbi:MAG: DNA-directed RNA polymerase subunit alpha [Candidatus Portnoybacteria bacterium]|nr:DNA-directed RNA polymerase subunit alpha [Candidatus Portnoybacteria bacterium]
MQISLSLPPKVIKQEGNKALFEMGGCYPGYGITLGNALRRVLLSSLDGAAITGVKINGVQHEFSTIPFVVETVLDIILNLKQIRLKSHSNQPVKIFLGARGEKEVTARDIEFPSEVEIINKDAHIATLTDKKAKLGMEMEVGRGLGYETVESRKKERLEIGQIAVDAIFTPVKKINFEVENMRVGERTDYNRLRLEIETDGTMSPSEALEKAGKILTDQFALIRDFTKKEETKTKKKDKEKQKDKNESESGKMDKIRITELKISSRTIKSLTGVGIKTAGGLGYKTLFCHSERSEESLANARN